MKRPADSNGAGMTRLNFPFPQIATGDLDIPVLGQLAATNLPLGDEFEPGPVEVIGFEAPFRRAGFRKQDLEDAPGNPHDALIFADADAELDSVPVGVPPGVGRKTKEHYNLLGGEGIMFLYCSQYVRVW
jgi:hypothetical protein